MPAMGASFDHDAVRSGGPAGGAAAVGLAILLGLSLPAVVAQQPAPPQPPGKPAELPVPAPQAPLDPAAARAAQTLLDAQAARSRGVRVLVADYVQTRTTPLLKEPLVSRGQFLFVRDPACIVFRASEPRAAVIRLLPTTYEVFRPQKQQLERFRFDGPQLAEGLFAAVGGDVELLRKEFAVRSCGEDSARPGCTRIVLLPLRDEVRARLSELSLCLSTEDAALRAVGYRDPAGDLVEIELRNVAVDPTKPPSAEFEVPPETRVIEHAPPKPQPK